MDAGELVPDDLIIAHDPSSVCRRTTPATASCSTASRAPSSRRTRSTRRSRSTAARLTAALLIDAARTRRSCAASPGAALSPSSGRVYHVEFDPPAASRAYATRTAQTLVQRDDDRPETVRKRLEVYHEQTAPLDRPTTRSAGCCTASTERATPTEVHDHVRATIATLRLEADV